MRNNQVPIKQYFDDRLNVHSIFFTIQGEGPFAGCPAVFIRLTGCNLQCPNCDTDYTSNSVSLTPAAIVEAATKMLPAAHVDSPTRSLIVITGGEPFAQKIGPLVVELANAGLAVQVETNGTLRPDDVFLAFATDNPDEVTVVCSPKTGSVNQDLAPHIHSMKYVLRADNIDPADGLPLTALDHPAKPRLARPHTRFLRGTVYVQPEDEGDAYRNGLNVAAAATSAMRFNHTLCLQIHKIIGME